MTFKYTLYLFVEAVARMCFTTLLVKDIITVGFKRFFCDNLSMQFVQLIIAAISGS